MLTEVAWGYLLSGAAGLGLLGALIKKAMDSYIEAKTKLATSVSNDKSMISAMSISWDRDQQEKMLQLMERLVDAQEQQAISVSKLAIAQTDAMNQRISKLLEVLEKSEQKRR